MKTKKNDAARKLAASKLARIEASISDCERFGISRVNDKPNLDALINKAFVRDIAAIILDAPESGSDDEQV